LFLIAVLVCFFAENSPSASAKGHCGQTEEPGSAGHFLRFRASECIVLRGREQAFKFALASHFCLEIDLETQTMPEQDWSGFLENLPPITVLSFGNDAVRKAHRLSDILPANLFAYKQYARSERFTAVIDEIEDMWLDEKAPLGMILRKAPFGGMRIDKIKTSDAKLWLIKLQHEDGKGYSSIHTIRGVLRPAFQMAEEDDLIRKNPFGFELCTVVENDSVKREAITEHQEQEYLDFIRSDKQYRQYCDAIFILFNTGLRISEFCGLTVSDIDFENRCDPCLHQESAP
jgi:hypothetical protein